MKKIMLVVMAMVCALALAACSSGSQSEGPGGLVEPDNEGRELQFTVTLPGNPTTGYSWQYTMEPEGVVREIANDYVQDEADDGMAGVPGVFTFVFEGVAEGMTQLDFTYGQPWDGGEMSDDVASYTLAVDSEMYISVEASYMNIASS
ncbi:MAG: protease inhibitor I42 family protein [Clostridiales bacterium]|nr:protease inhibitor I42 family protein [Clostridiales bacterium]